MQGLVLSPSEPCHLPISEFSSQASVQPVCEEPIAERPHVKISIYKTGICRITINARAISGTLISDSSMPQLKYSKISLLTPGIRHPDFKFKVVLTNMRSTNKKQFQTATCN